MSDALVNRPVLMNEIRYAERLCQRTARFYRHVQAMNTFLSVVGGSTAVSATFATGLPAWIQITGACTFAIFGGLNIAMRPADKAAQNEMDAKRYAALRLKAISMDDATLQLALQEARVGDTAEVESLRDVAFNDVLNEIGQTGLLIPLSLRQRAFACVA